MKNFIALLLCCISTSGFSQLYNPVKWSTAVEKISATEYKLISTATIKKGWHLYAQEIPEDGPLATTFIYEHAGETIELLGKTSEPKGHIEEDPVFEMTLKYFENSAVFEQRISLKENLTNINALVEFMACDDEKCLPPTEVDLVFKIENNATKTSDVNQEEKSLKQTNTARSTAKKPISKKGIFSIFLIAFLFGFTALLTPCVFPMIPLTVSFFTKQSKNKAQGMRNALFFGLSIVVIYVLLGTLVTAIFGASALNALSTNVWFNLLFFFILLLFAASFLGAFELTLPSSWSTKVDERANKGGLIGIFFMALALAIVSFSCTGPIVGTILVEAATGGSLVGPIIGMLGFSMAIALPFTLFAAFPGWMNSLPKSGGWLNTVKVVLGFLELAFAFKFLSNADLVLQLHWLEREVFLAIWICIFSTMAFYLFGKIQLAHDSPLTNISVGRLSLGMLSLTFAFYLFPGLWGAPLNLISAFPPPQHYSESPYGVGYTKMGDFTTATHNALPDGAHLMAPHNILAFNDYDKGLAYAKKVGKPVLLDFTGHACVNCRKMEQNVWVKPKVLDILKHQLVLISLYVDDKRKLKEDEIVASKLRPGKQLKYIGQKWSELQTLQYKANSQPFYVLMGHDEENLIDPIAYTPNVEEYYTWLTEGITSFH